MGTENFVRLAVLKHDSITSPDNDLDLFPARSAEWSDKFYAEAFHDPLVTAHLSISDDFDPKRYMTEINGPLGNSFGGSPTKALYHIYKRGYFEGPIGHVSVKEIDWKNLTFHRGMVLKKQFLGQGIGPKVGFVILDHMKKLGFKRAFTEVKGANLRSLNAVRKQFGEGVLTNDGQYHFELDLTKPLEWNPFLQ
jgi:hypothetical protein